MPLFQSSFAFQEVRWSDKHGGLLAAEQGSRLWLLDEDAGTTIYRLHADGDRLLLSRMNRVVQAVKVQP